MNNPYSHNILYQESSDGFASELIFSNVTADGAPLTFEVPLTLTYEFDRINLKSIKFNLEKIARIKIKIVEEDFNERFLVSNLNKILLNTK